ncbi:MAG TPA: hypothetical protein VHY48_07685 [Acidobacteriaceae bacterium]|jgi:hypothetical protein|nr:hypothetical protein [Acidobacteriaceae bacterium]
MRVAWRVAVVLTVFVGVGLLTEHWKMMQGLAAGGRPGMVRPMAWGAGLFAGGIAAVGAGFVVFWKR